MYHSEEFSLGVWPVEPSEYETDELVTVYGADDLPVFKNGKIQTEWKRVYKISSFIDPMIRSSLSAEGRHVKASGIWADLQNRLKTTREAGICLLKAAEMGEEMENLADTEKKALEYISGYKQKKQTYAQWKASKEWRRRNG